ncbi:MAG: type II toxin-antitoxin system PemK/MazF family toxin [Kiritimatiellae bacterium]|nr:type II toxin-antitoxin system PemK/MazF family toxin [Kiritimatiellia bacterium]MDD4024760.1 type II toxin-antitoxin system PemK/MazF family toxin [Kiritimatiellia bacterium]MDD4622278.1 type II toxin-antitoxin system PemK/MazF family toxin [Kiritimatiellia bacterium]
MSEATITRGDVWWVSLDPTQGSEIKKTRPCVVLTHNTVNKLRKTIIVIPLSSTASPHPPITVPVICQKREVVAVIDQIRAVAKHRFKSKIGMIAPNDLDAIIRALSTILEIR